MARDYAGSEVAPQIRYLLGCAYKEAGQLERAETTLKQLEVDAPDTTWAEMASSVCRFIAQERSTRAAVAARIDALRSQSTAQRAFQAGERRDVRDARLPVPHRPGSVSDTEDPRRAGDLERP
jgi:hypothetical protein